MEYSSSTNVFRQESKTRMKTEARIMARLAMCMLLLLVTVFDHFTMQWTTMCGWGKTPPRDQNVTTKFVVGRQGAVGTDKRQIAVICQLPLIGTVVNNFKMLGQSICQKLTSLVEPFAHHYDCGSLL